MKYNKNTSDQHNIATTRHLNRILTVLGEQKRPITRKEISILTSVGSKSKDALLWLSNNGILIKERGKIRKIGKGGSNYITNSYYYMINPKFLELRK